MLRSLLLARAAALCTISLVPVYARAADVCQAVNDALTKVITTPHHVYMSETAAYIPRGATRTSELISASNGTMYLRLHDKWQVSRMTVAEMLQQQRENLARDNKESCQLLRQESINGELAAVFKVHTETEDDKMDGQIWVSKSKGLPLRQELDMDVGGAAGKSHRDMRYDYANVNPPQM